MCESYVIKETEQNDGYGSRDSDFIWSGSLWEGTPIWRGEFLCLFLLKYL